MRTSDKGVASLISHEGIVPGPYRDSVGVWTFGIGHTAAAGEPFPSNMPRGMPDNIDAAIERAFVIFRRDLEKYEAAVRRAFSRELTQEQFDAAVSFHYNTGGIGRASWVRSFNSGRNNRARAEFMNWRRPAEIIPRREAERDLFFSGKYPEGGITVWQVDSSGRVIWKPARRLTESEALGMMWGQPDVDPITHPEPVEQGGLWAAIAAIFTSIFGGKK